MTFNTRFGKKIRMKIKENMKNSLTLKNENIVLLKLN